MRGYSFLPLLVLTASVFSPRELAHVQNFYLSPMKIVANRNSPAFSAIEDAFVIDEFVNNEASDQKRIGEQNENTDEEIEKKLKLKGIRVSLNEKPVRFKNINLKGELVEVAHFTNKFILNKTRKPKVMLAQSEVAHLSSPEIVKKTVEGVTITTERVRKLSAASPSITTPENLDPVVLPNGVSISNWSRSLAQGKNTDDEKEESSVQKIAPRFVKKASVSTVAFDRPNIISGSIDLENLGDLVGDNFSYYINRSLDGRVYESGVVDAQKSTFEMEVGAVKGTLSVELRSEKGEVLAYGELVLNRRLKSFRVPIFPSENLMTGRVLSAAESVDGDEVAVAESTKEIESVEGELKVDEEGYFNEQIFDKGSSFIVETKAKDYWSDLNFGMAGKPLYPRLIKKDIFAEFAKTLDPFGEEFDVTSAIVGSVTQSGLPQRDVEVKLFKSEYQKPVYFKPNGAADPSLKKTSSNGGFIFVNIPDGGYLVQAIRSGKVITQKWYIVKEGYIAQGQLNIEKTPSVIASAESFPEQRESRDFNLNELGVDQNFVINSETEELIKTKTHSEILALKIDKTEQNSSHIYLTSSKTRKKRFKVIEQKWLEQFLNRRRSNANRAMGLVVGFINSNMFKVIKQTTTAQSQTSQVFYFDRFGEQTEVGVAGGGFIITDVPSGLSSVVVAIRGRDTFLNKLVVVEPRSISIF